MISRQIDELRELAGDGSMEWVSGPVRAIVLRDAADTIWELRCRLVDAEGRVRKSGELCKLCEREAENAKLRERVAELEELLPDSGRWYRAETVEAYVAEIAKLRDELDQWHRLTAGIELPEYPITEFKPKDLERENAKLREYIDLKETCWKHVGWCAECPYNGVDGEHDNCNCTTQEKIDSLAHELGIEVE